MNTPVVCPFCNSITFKIFEDKEVLRIFCSKCKKFLDKEKVVITNIQKQIIRKELYGEKC